MWDLIALLLILLPVDAPTPATAPQPLWTDFEYGRTHTPQFELLAHACYIGNQLRRDIADQRRTQS